MNAVQYAAAATRLVDDHDLLQGGRVDFLATHPGHSESGRIESAWPRRDPPHRSSDQPAAVGPIRETVPTR